VQAFRNGVELVDRISFVCFRLLECGPAPEGSPHSVNRSLGFRVLPTGIGFQGLAGCLHLPYMPDAVRLATDVAEGLRRHSSQFLGTGVVRAYRAESCGLKGMRIFVHPKRAADGGLSGRTR